MLCVSTIPTYRVYWLNDERIYDMPPSKPLFNQSQLITFISWLTPSIELSIWNCNPVYLVTFKRTVKQSGSQSLMCVCLEEVMDRFEVPHILCKIPVIQYASITPIPGCVIWERITQVLYDSMQIAFSYSIIFVFCLLVLGKKSH